MSEFRSTGKLWDNIITPLHEGVINVIKIKLLQLLVKV